MRQNYSVSILILMKGSDGVLMDYGSSWKVKSREAF